MHFILLVYNYEYIMNKSSYFVELLILCGIFQHDRAHGRQLLKCEDLPLFFFIHLEIKGK